MTTDQDLVARLREFASECDYETHDRLVSQAVTRIEELSKLILPVTEAATEASLEMFNQLQATKDRIEELSARVEELEGVCEAQQETIHRHDTEYDHAVTAEALLREVVGALEPFARIGTLLERFIKGSGNVSVNEYGEHMRRARTTLAAIKETLG